MYKALPQLEFMFTQAISLNENEDISIHMKNSWINRQFVIVYSGMWHAFFSLHLSIPGQNMKAIKYIFQQFLHEIEKKFEFFSERV